MDIDTSGEMLLAESPSTVHRHRLRCGDVRQQPAIRASELQPAVRQPLDAIPLLVNRAVMPATEQRQIGERRRTAVRPVPQVMALAERQTTAREAAAAIAMPQGPS